MYRMRTLAALLLSLSLSTVACSGGNFFDSVNDAVNTNPFDIDVVVYNDTSEAVCQVYVAESTLGLLGNTNLLGGTALQPGQSISTRISRAENAVVSTATCSGFAYSGTLSMWEDTTVYIAQLPDRTMPVQPTTDTGSGTLQTTDPQTTDYYTTPPTGSGGTTYEYQEHTYEEEQNISCCVNGTQYVCSPGTSMMDCIEGTGGCTASGGC